MKVKENYISNLKSLCDQHHVDKLYIFGSVLTPSFNEKSDIDFLVRFKDMDLAGYFDNYIGLKENLQQLFGRDIDLVEEQTLKNPILIHSIDKNKELVYG